MKGKKVKVEIFVPVGACICSFVPLIEKVGQITSKFKDIVEVQTKSTKSKEAAQYGVQDVCVVIGGKKFFPNFDEKEFKDTIEKEWKTG